MAISAFSPPRAVQALAALASGLALCAAVTLVTSFLSAIAIPLEYFAFFGRQYTELALFLLNTLTVAVPMAAVGFVWCLVTARFVRLSLLGATMLCLVGYLIGFTYSYFASAISFIALEADGKVPLSVFLRSGLNWWNVPVLVAVPLGILGAGRLRAKSLRTAR